MNTARFNSADTTVIVVAVIAVEENLFKLIERIILLFFEDRINIRYLYDCVMLLGQFAHDEIC